MGNTENLEAKQKLKESKSSESFSPLSKGDALFALAKQKVTRNAVSRWLWNWDWDSQTDRDERITKCVEAAAQYKMAKAWKQAHLAHAEAARLALENKDVNEAIHHLQQAAQFLSYEDAKGAIGLYKEAIELQREQGKFGAAAKLWKKIAETEEGEGRTQEAIRSWQEAADCFQIDDSQLASSQALIRKADLLGLFHLSRSDVKSFQAAQEAISIYEEVAEGASEGSRWVLKDYLFRSSLLCLLLEIQGDKVLTQDKVRRYKEDFPLFDGCRECILVESIDALLESKEHSETRFVSLLREYERGTTLDTWTTRVLLHIKQAILHGMDVMDNTDTDTEIDLR
jgi:alpha-soluble NSF attachment protein